MALLKFILIICLVVGMGILYHVYYLTGEDISEYPAFTENEIIVKPINVSVQKAFIGDLVQEITVNGVTEAIQEIGVKSIVSAHVKDMLVRDGEEVKAGQILVKLDDREAKISLKEARIQWFTAKAEYEILKQGSREYPTLRKQFPETLSSTSNQQKIDELYKLAKQKYQTGEMTEEAYREIEREYFNAQIISGKKQDEIMAYKSGLATAEALVARAEYNLQNCQIKAPFAGVISKVTVNVGDLVSPNQILMRLVNLKKLHLNLQVLDAELGQVKVGETIDATFSAYLDTIFTGQIIGVDPIVDPITRSGRVIAKVSNMKYLLKSGMFATVRIALNHYSNRLLVPRAAVLERDQRKLVFILREGKAVWCNIETGLENDKYIEVVNSKFNLKPGELIITEGHFALAHNAPVEVD